MYTSLALWAALMTVVTAQVCTTTNCMLPNCRCFGDLYTPGYLALSQTPQIVMLTFEGTINSENLPDYQMFFNEANPNGCAARGTFFIQDEGTDYKLVSSLATSGHEIGIHSVDGKLPTGSTAWIQAIKKVRTTLEQHNIDTKNVLGVRAPEFSFDGDAEMIGLGSNMTYDSSCASNWRSQKENMKWPFTLDYSPGLKLCDIGTDVTKPFPGKWMVPADDLHDLQGDPKLPCIAPSACRGITTKQNAFDLFHTAFIDHYTGQKTPFLMVIDPSWAKNKNLRDGTLEFLQYIRSAYGNNVWIVPVQKAIQWVQTPTPMANLTNFAPWGCS